MNTVDMFFSVCMLLSLNTVLTAVIVVVLVHGNSTRKDDCTGYVDMTSFPSDFRNDNNYSDKKEARYQYVRSTLSKETFILDTYTGNLTKINFPVYREL